MGSWVGGAGVAKGDRQWEPGREVGALASGRARGCDRTGECTALWVAGTSASGFAVGSKGSGERCNSCDVTLVPTEESEILGPYRKGGQAA